MCGNQEHLINTVTVGCETSNKSTYTMANDDKWHLAKMRP